MKFLRNKKTCVAALLCAMALSLGGMHAAAVVPVSTDLGGGIVKGVARQERAALASFEGTVEDFAVDDAGRTVWLMRRTGDAADAPLIQVAVTENTKTDFDGGAANGDILSVEYRGEEIEMIELVVDGVGKDVMGRTVYRTHQKDAPSVKKNIVQKAEDWKRGDTIYLSNQNGSLIAERVSKRQALPQVVFGGEVLELLPGGQGSDGGFLLRQFTDDPATAEQIIFHYGSETDIATEDGKIEVGDRLNVTYNGILSRSLPPQGFASQISDYDVPAVLPQ